MHYYGVMGLKRKMLLICLAATILAGAATGAIVWQLSRWPAVPEPEAQSPVPNNSAADGKTLPGSAPTPSSSKATPPKTTNTAPPPKTTSQPAAAKTPGTFLGLSNWKLTLPINTSHSGNPDEILQPELQTFSQNPYFYLNSTQTGVVFRAYANGKTTSGSGYPRSELREMKNGGSQEASWSSASGISTMTVRQAITHLPVVKPEVVAGQVHDSSDDVIEIKLTGSLLEVWAENGSKRWTLDSSYKLGATFSLKVQASSGHIHVYYNDALKADYARSGSGFYFKAGCYTQSNLAHGDSASAYGEVVIYSLSVSHT